VQSEEHVALPGGNSKEKKQEREEREKEGRENNPRIPLPFCSHSRGTWYRGENRLRERSLKREIRGAEKCFEWRGKREKCEAKEGKISLL
jgi:hypothetical protein